MASPKNIESIYRLTPTQEGILYHALKADDKSLYHQQFTCELKGPLDRAAMTAAWQAAVDRHPALRSLFTWKKRPHPLHVVREEVATPVEFPEDAALIDGGERLESFLADDRARGFELESAPLFRVAVVAGESGLHRLIWSFHHLILDGWSMRQVLAEVLRNHAAIRAGRSAGWKRSNPGTKGEHESYVEWLAVQDDERAVAHWRRLLGGFESKNELAIAKPASGGGESHRTISTKLDGETSARLTSVLRDAGLTLSTAMRGVWSATLAAYCGGLSDVVFGATVSGRPSELPGIEAAVGMFIQTIPVRARIPSSGTIEAYLRQLQADQLDGMPYETASLAEIQRAAKVPAGEGLFDSILVIENHAAADLDGPVDLEVSGARYVERSHYPLALLVDPGDSMALILVHDGAQVAGADAERILLRVEDTLKILSAGLGQSAAELTEPSPGEQPAALRARDAQTGSVADDVLTSFLVHAERTPSALAVVALGGATLSYGDLERRARLVAGDLGSRGVRAGDRVGIQMERGVEAVAAILGCLMTRAAYVPLDPSAPVERTRSMVEAAGISVILDRAGYVGSPHAGGGESSVDDLAYVLFTSGSTGVPKGVEITRDALARSTAARTDFYRGTPERFLLLSPLHFDSSVAGLFWTLTTGGTLVLPRPGDERDAQALQRAVRTSSITHTLLLPSLWDIVLETADDGDLASLECVIVAGEAVSPALISRHRSSAADAQLFNEYGPTEATVWATVAELTGHDPAQPVPIGRPVGEVGALVLGANGQALPVGVAGELWLLGPTLARGYVSGESGSFVALESANGARAYRTGDRVRVGSDGQLLFLGRVDRQVKIRGHRVELGEVEAALAQAPAIREAWVVAVPVARGGGALELVAYAAGSGGDVDATLAHLRAQLPPAMVPSRLELLADLPRTPTGKVDGSRLRERAAQSQSVREEDPSRRDARRPSTPLEAELCALWCSTLGLENVGVDENFYGLGGDSLTSIRLVARAHKAGHDIDLASFAADPTIEGMARSIAASKGRDVSAAGSNALPLTSEGPVALSPVQSWFFGLDLPEPAHWNQSVVIDWHDKAATAEDIVGALRQLVERHEALRLRFVERDGERMQEAAAAPSCAEALTVRVIEELSVQAGERDALIEEIHRSFDLGSGALFGACIEIGGDTPRVTLVAHHIAVDVLSWETLIEDLATPLNEWPERLGFLTWTREALAAATTTLDDAVAERWLAIGEAQPAGIPRDRADAGSRCGTVASEASLTRSLGVAATDSLMNDVPPVYGTRVLDPLLLALVRALEPWMGRAGVTLELEGHGRDLHAIGVKTLPSDVVGWLTATWPVSLVTLGGEVGEDLKSIKEQLRSIPEPGASFGLYKAAGRNASLRTGLSQLPRREVLFNYMGSLSADGASPTAALASSDRTGRSRLGDRAYVLEINAWQAEGTLVTHWSYSSELHHASTVAALADRFETELAAVIEHCADPAAGGVTPSDFPLAGLDQGELDRLGEILGGS